MQMKKSSKDSFYIIETSRYFLSSCWSLKET